MNAWTGKFVQLRAVEPSDAPFFFESQADTERARHLSHVWPLQSRVAIAEWVDKQTMRSGHEDNLMWMIDSRSGQTVGSISTHHCEPRTGSFSFALDIATRHRRRGYAADAIRIVMRHYFGELRYQKATVSIHADNEASLKLHESLGFVHEGRLRRMVFTGAQHIDEIWLGMTVEEFLGRHTLG